MLAEIDVAAPMKTKLDVDLWPHVIRGACNPPLAQRALTPEPSVSLLPCNIVVRSIGDAETLAVTVDPGGPVAVTRRPELATVADQAAEATR